MPYDNRRQIRRQLEAELLRPRCRDRLRILQTEFPVLQPFSDWLLVVRHLLDPSVHRDVKDEILRALIWTLQREAAPELNTTLIVTFWPALATIAGRCAAWDPDPDELWHNLQWTFLQAVHGIEVLRMPSRIAQRLCHAVYDAFRTEYRRTWSRNHHETTLLDDAPDAWPNTVSNPSRPTDPACRALEVLAKSRLIRARREHALSPSEFNLLVAIDWGGMSLEEFARDAGIEYDTAKKRRQRALAKVRSVDSQELRSRRRKFVPGSAA